MTSERERFEAYIQRVMPARSRSTDADRQHYAAVKEHLWSGWQARAALPAPADQPTSQEPQGSSGSLSESGVEAGLQVAASASVSGYGALAAMDLLRRIEPHIDAIVCYASTCDEHEPNLIAKDLRTLLHSYPYVPAFAWQPIETAQWQERALLYAPPENLYEKPQGRPGEFRVTRRADWTWATHWMPLPQPPSADAAVVPAQHGASDNSEQDQPKGCHECAWGKVAGCWRCGSR